jgi:cell division GTPase FtsZ
MDEKYCTESYFDDDVADNFCILKHNIQIQISNIKKILRFNHRTAKETEILKILLQEYGSLKKICGQIALDFEDVLEMMVGYDELSEIFDSVLYHMENKPILEMTQQFFPMDDTDSLASETYAYQYN